MYNMFPGVETQKRKTKCEKALHGCGFVSDETTFTVAEYMYVRMLYILVFSLTIFYNTSLWNVFFQYDRKRKFITLFLIFFFLAVVPWKWSGALHKQSHRTFESNLLWWLLSFTISSYTVIATAHEKKIYWFPSKLDSNVRWDVSFEKNTSSSKMSGTSKKRRKRMVENVRLMRVNGFFKMIYGIKAEQWFALK